MAELTPTLRFDFSPPLQEFHVALSRFGSGISDFRDLWPVLGNLFKQEMAAQFATEGVAGGERWAPLSDDYKTWKDAHYPGRTIGVLTGALAQSMTGGPGYTEILSPMAAEFGMSDSSPAAEYGSYFDGGTDKMPARPVLAGLDRPDYGRAWAIAAAAWVRGEAHHAGLMGAMSASANASLSDLSYHEALPAT